MMEKLALAGEGGGCTPFTLVTLTYKVAVNALAARADTLTHHISSLPLYVPYSVDIPIAFIQYWRPMGRPAGIRTGWCRGVALQLPGWLTTVASSQFIYPFVQSRENSLFLNTCRTEPEFVKTVRSLGFDSKESGQPIVCSLADRYDNPICRTGPLDYICWRNRFLGIGS